MSGPASHDRCAKCGFILGPRRRIIGEFAYHTDCSPETYGTTLPVIRQEPLEITLRDFFAAAALTGFLSDIRRQYPERDGPEATDLREAAAIESYRFADAMLEARKAKP